MNIFSRLRRTIIKENNIYKFGDIFGDLINEEVGVLDIDNPEFYDIETKTLKLGNLCAKDIRDQKTPNINVGGRLYTTYCALAHLSNTLNPNLVPKFQYNIDKIYNFLRRDLKYDNRVKFHSLMKSILEYDDPANTMNIIVEFIEDTDSVDEIANALDRFRSSNDLSQEDIDSFLRFIKSTGHQEYEKSFYGEHFEKFSTKLTLKYKNQSEYISVVTVVEDVLDGKYAVDKAVSLLYGNIVKNYNALDMIKSDLKCIKDVFDDDGNVIIKSGDLIEVKKLDYAADSYLSEFMAIYKSSRLPDYAHETKFLKIYNQIIDGLYLELKNRTDILEDIRKNFAGIIYDNNIFVSKDNIELYWSNKGRPSCLKDHRLSIRYRVNKSKLTAYVYEGGDVLNKKPINMVLSDEKLLCPILKNNSISESYTIKDISNLLVEGRKEDARVKYPDVPESDFNYFVENDPSGNQKYLDWLLKYYWQVSPDTLVEDIEFFHQHQNMFIEKDINKHTPTSLDREIGEVKEKILQKKEKKQAKKQSVKVYEDDTWLVISPKSWEASCYYGAGTKWCITMKNNSSYWRRYSKRASFFFIIDKTKSSEDPLYKVAYRKIGLKGKYELWDATDAEISRQKEGEEYFEGLPNEMKERINMLHIQNFPINDERPEWIENDPRAQAIVNLLDTDDIEDVEDYWYGMAVFFVDGDHYIVGNAGEMDEALRVYYDQHDNDELMEYYDPSGYYLKMIDEDDFISSEVIGYLENMSEREKIETADLLDKEREIEIEIEDLESELEETEEEDKISVIEGRLKSLRESLNGLVVEAEEIISELYREEIERCLSDGPKECLVDERGWYSNVRELYRSGLVEFDRDGLIDVIVNDSSWEHFLPYGYDEITDDEGSYWYVSRIDY
jgi:hypothetical protein